MSASPGNACCAAVAKHVLAGTYQTDSAATCTPDTAADTLYTAVTSKYTSADTAVLYLIQKVWRAADDIARGYLPSTLKAHAPAEVKLVAGAFRKAAVSYVAVVIVLPDLFGGVPEGKPAPADQVVRCLAGTADVQAVPADFVSDLLEHVQSATASGDDMSTPEAVVGAIWSALHGFLLQHVPNPVAPVAPDAPADGPAAMLAAMQAHFQQQQQAGVANSPIAAGSTAAVAADLPSVQGLLTAWTQLAQFKPAVAVLANNTNVWNTFSPQPDTPGTFVASSGSLLLYTALEAAGAAVERAATTGGRPFAAALAPAGDDLVAAAIEAQWGVDRASPGAPHYSMQAGVQAAVESNQRSARTTLAAYAGQIKLALETMSRKGAKEAMLAGISAWLARARPRNTMAFSHDGKVPDKDVPSHGACMLALHVMLGLVGPIVAPGSKLTEKVDVRYGLEPPRNLSPTEAGVGRTGARFSNADEPRLCSLEVAIGETDDAVQDATWIDRRNLARQLQFAGYQRQLLAEEGATASSPGAGTPADAAGMEAPELPQYSGASELFWACAQTLQIVLTSSSGRMSHIMSELQRSKALARRAEAVQQVAALPTPQQRMAATFQVSRSDSILRSWMRDVIVLLTLLGDEALLDASLPAGLCLARMVVQALAQPGANFPLASPALLALPLPPPARNAVCMPETWVSAVAKWTEVILAYVSPRVVFPKLTAPVMSTLLDFIVVILGARAAVTSPYLRCSMLTLLQYFVPQRQDPARTPHGRSKGAPLAPPYQHGILAHRFAETSLLPAVCMNFVDIGYAGGHAVFYDKLQFRQPACQVIEFLWDASPAHRASLTKWLQAQAAATTSAAEAATLKGLEFVTAILNDLDYTLNDEGFKLLESIRELQAQRRAGQWAALAPDAVREKEGELAHKLQQVKYFLRLATSYMKLLSQLTTEQPVCELLCAPRIVERTATLLNSFLSALAGPNNKLLRVENMAELDFNPRFTLLGTCAVYANLTHGALVSFPEADPSKPDGDPLVSPWCKSVVGEPRYWGSQGEGLGYFQKAVKVLNGSDWVTSDEAKEAVPGQAPVAVLSRVEGELLPVLTVAVERFLVEDALDLDAEAPDEFLDPLTAAIMQDPVKLPGSGIVIDRPTIERALLDKHEDPFNRDHLTVDMLEPLPELLAQIKAWVAEKRAAAKQDVAATVSAGTAAGAAAEVMSPGTAAPDASPAQQRGASSPMVPPPVPGSEASPAVPPSVPAAPTVPAQGGDADEDEDELAAAIAASLAEQ